jgi:hypothetical protein
MEVLVSERMNKMKEIFQALSILVGTCIYLTIFISFGIKHNRKLVIEWIKTKKSYFWAKWRVKKYKRKGDN